MLDFTKKGVINLHGLPLKMVNKNVLNLLHSGENVVAPFAVVRDQVIFTNKRIITVEVNGITGVQQDIFSLPYRKVQYYGIKTAGFAEVIPDSSLLLFFADGKKAEFHFQEKANIIEIGRIIGMYC